MKKNKTLFIFRCLLFAIIFSFPMHASSVPSLTCESVRNFDRYDYGESDYLSQLQGLLDGISETDGVYKLCLNIINGPIPLSNGLVFNRDTGGRPVVLSGFNLKRNPAEPSNFPLLTLSSPSPVTLVNSDIQGVGALDQGACLVLQGNGHVFS